MSIVVRFSPASLTTETYDEAIRRLKEAGRELCFGTARMVALLARNPLPRGRFGVFDVCVSVDRGG